MFCKNCGAQMPDDNYFCPKCGAAQNGSSTVAVAGVSAAAPIQDTEALIRQMEASFGVMTKIKEQEGKIDDCDARIEKAEKMSRLRWVLLFGFIGFILAGIIDSATKVDFLAILIWLAGNAFGIWFIIMQKSKKKKIEQEKNTELSVLAGLKEQPELAWLGPDYRDSFAFACIYRYITNHRANSLTEAINVYETERHRERMELISMITAQSAADAASAASAAAGSAAASAFFSLFR